MTNAITAAAATAAAPTANATPAADRLGKQDFLKILIAQLRNQDPMKPMEDREFISQMAQFSSLEAMQNLDKRVEELAGAQALGQAAALIGKRVDAKLDSGEQISGIVEEVRLGDGKPRFVVDGRLIDHGQITVVGAG
ncbi:MAG: flagellar hook assembly protein FlgD [Chloroflexi bacterium]|nr:flagellar hook assembly protein FlgD [Chloroflexota bacterium]